MTFVAEALPISKNILLIEVVDVFYENLMFGNDVGQETKSATNCLGMCGLCSIIVQRSTECSFQLVIAFKKS